ncbi:LysR family transcriptional regulator [Candidimonas nitroreducens]|uniref:LysR family transcriptional regulator n=1 Tax=Candidimonas nitroreducens TaxID=683354 RepID=UPI001E5545CE|nr:LysR family transcriptional regulator [Candidimonas nitroreducens]
MNLRQLEVFHAIIRAGSVTGAARDLNVTQPAISAVLKHTEQQLNMKLFERVSGRLQPTPEAIILLPDVENVFARIDTIRRLAHSLRDGRAGQIVIATSPTLVNAFLPQAVASLRKQGPDMKIYVRSLPTPLAIDRVSRREADIGIVYGPVEEPSVTSERFVCSEIVCALREDHPLATEPKIDTVMLANEPVISMGASTFLGHTIIETCRRESLEAPRVGVEASSSLAACMMVQAGAGVALIDRITEVAQHSDGVVFRPFVPRIVIEVVLLFPRDRPRSRATRRLVALLKELAPVGFRMQDGAGRSE